MNINKYLKVSQEVQDALKNNKPVVALESTIISHGMPYPKNMETALECERIIRESGSLPATIAIIKGKLCVGLSKEEIEFLAKGGKDIYKTSRRDIPYVVSNNLSGATTVASTMYIASLVGIKVFATGGIGGVHRGCETSLDISADLDELAMTDVCVVCAGAKAILDLPKTLEYLETKGVPVIGYKTSSLPAFYSKESPFNVPLRIDDFKQISNTLKVKWDLGLHGGVLVCNPIPDAYSKDYDEMNLVIELAIKKMNSLQIIGKDQTPFLLKTITELTSGSSLDSNIKLVYNNCHLASLIALEYSKLCD